MITEVMCTKDKYMRNIRTAIAKGLQNNVTKENIMELLQEIEIPNRINNGK